MGVKVTTSETKFIGRDHSFSKHTKFLRKTNISNPLIRTRTCQGVRNISILENFANALYE